MWFGLGHWRFVSGLSPFLPIQHQGSSKKSDHIALPTLDSLPERQAFHYQMTNKPLRYHLQMSIDACSENDLLFRTAMYLLS